MFILKLQHSKFFMHNNLIWTPSVGNQNKATVEWCVCSIMVFFRHFSYKLSKKPVTFGLSRISPIRNCSGPIKTGWTKDSVLFELLCYNTYLNKFCFLQMDFVIPVLTDGYFAALKHPNPQARILDERYIQFIHDILISKYIHSNCLNLQVRPVIPSQSVNTIYNKQEFIHNSIFNAWKSDDEINVLARNMLKSRRTKLYSHWLVHVIWLLTVNVA